MHYAFVSFGNNDIAMLQWALNNNIQVTAIYAETGWASESWAQRVADCTKWCEDRGIPVHTTSPRIGMGEYIIENGEWPSAMNGLFCKNVKSFPSLRKLEELDPEREGTMMFSPRRSDGAHRLQWPEFDTSSEGRDVWFPMVRVTNEERDALVAQAGFEVLPHRSLECGPCVFANATDIKALTEADIQRVEAVERAMTPEGSPTVPMFPVRFYDAVGIREVVEKAHSGAQFRPKKCPCDGGWCSG